MNNMLRRKMTYTDYDGVERIEDFYFHLSKAEIMEMEMGTDGGMVQMLTKIVESKDSKRIVETFKDFILKAYGEKSPDGKRFIKTPEITVAFAQTEAYSDLFMELATNANAAAAFVNAVIPQNIGKNNPQIPSGNN